MASRRLLRTALQQSSRRRNYILAASLRKGEDVVSHSQHHPDPHNHAHRSLAQARQAERILELFRQAAPEEYRELVRRGYDGEGIVYLLNDLADGETSAVDYLTAGTPEPVVQMVQDWLHCN